MYFFSFTKLGIEFQWKPRCSLNAAKKEYWKGVRGVQGEILLGQNSYYDPHAYIAGQSYFLCNNNNVVSVLQNALSYWTYLVHQIKL